jgi:hypothetical protein
VGKLVIDDLQGLYAIHFRHFDVEKDDIRLILCYTGDKLSSIARFYCNLYLSVQFQGMSV